MKRIIIFLAAFLLISCNSELDTLIFKQFQKFITKYKKKYSSIDEFLSRYQIFKENIISIVNSEKSSFKKGITKFSDLTKQEFSKTYLNLNYDALSTLNSIPYTMEKTNLKAAPSSYDYRNTNKIGPSQDQGNCGSSWAFATAGILQSYYAMHIGKFEYLSKQMLVDCDTSDSGCNGGLMEYAFTWLTKNGGIMLESDYPYKGVRGACKSEKSKYIDMKVNGYFKYGSSTSTFNPVDEDEIKEFLYQTGPLGVVMNGDPLVSYVSGIIDVPSSECPASAVNVCLLLVGYGVDSDSGIPYWIVQNSWGEDWGESGFFKIRRGNSSCGINSYVITAKIKYD